MQNRLVKGIIIVDAKGMTLGKLSHLAIIKAMAAVGPVRELCC